MPSTDEQVGGAKGEVGGEQTLGGQAELVAFGRAQGGIDVESRGARARPRCREAAAGRAVEHSGGVGGIEDPLEGAGSVLPKRPLDGREHVAVVQTSREPPK